MDHASPLRVLVAAAVGSAVLCLPIGFGGPVHAGDGRPEPGQVEVDPGIEFLSRALSRHPVVLLGNTHRRPEIHAFEGEAVAALARAGRLTHVGLEIASDQQPRLDHFLTTGDGVDWIEVSPAIDHPALRDFLFALRPLSTRAGGPIEVVALDRPWRSLRETTRDAYMAARIAAVFDAAPGARMLVLVGNNHTLKDFAWKWGGAARFIPGELAALRPDLSVLSVHQCVDAGAETALRRDLDARLPSGSGPWGVSLAGPVGTLHDDSVAHLNSAPGVVPGALQDAVLYYRAHVPRAVASALPEATAPAAPADADGAAPWGGARTPPDPP